MRCAAPVLVGTDVPGANLQNVAHVIEAVILRIESRVPVADLRNVGGVSCVECAAVETARLVVDAEIVAAGLRNVGFIAVVLALNLCVERPVSNAELSNIRRKVFPVGLIVRRPVGKAALDDHGCRVDEVGLAVLREIPHAERHNASRGGSTLVWVLIPILPEPAWKILAVASSFKIEVLCIETLI